MISIISRSLIFVLIIAFTNVTFAKDKDYDSYFKAEKKCTTLSQRARKLANEIRRKKMKKCAKMNITHHDFYQRQKLEEAQDECKRDVQLEYENTSEEIQYNLDECYEAAEAYIK